MSKKIDVEEARELRIQYTKWFSMWSQEVVSRENKARAQAQKYVATHKKAAADARREAAKYDRKIKDIDRLLAAQEEATS